MCDVFPGRKKLTEAAIKYFSQQLVNGLQTLRDQELAHRDLKPDNIFLHLKNTSLLETDISHYHQIVLKIGDFGTCEQLLTGKKTHSYACGTVSYMAPEVIDMEPSETDGSLVARYGYKVDMWSLGMILFVSLCGLDQASCSDSRGQPLDPQLNQSRLKLFHQQMERKVSGLTTDSGSQSLINLLTKLVKRDVDLRLSFEQLKAHPFLTGLDEPDPNRNPIQDPVPDPYLHTIPDRNANLNHNPTEYRKLSAIYSGAIADEHRIPQRWDAFGHTGKYKVVRAFYRWELVFHGTITCEGVGIWRKENSKSLRRAFFEAFQQYMVHLCKKNIIDKEQMIRALNEQEDLGQSDKDDTISKIRN